MQNQINIISQCMKTQMNSPAPCACYSSSNVIWHCSEGNGCFGWTLECLIRTANLSPDAELHPGVNRALDCEFCFSSHADIADTCSSNYFKHITGVKVMHTTEWQFILPRGRFAYSSSYPLTYLQTFKGVCFKCSGRGSVATQLAEKRGSASRVRGALSWTGHSSRRILHQPWPQADRDWRVPSS